MRSLFKTIVLAAALAGLSFNLSAAEAPVHAAEASISQAANHGAEVAGHAVAASEHAMGAAHAEGEHHGLPMSAVPVHYIGGFPITNSMVAMVIVSLLLIFFAQLATRNIQQVPSGLQNVWEFMVEGLYNFLEGIVGPVLVKKTFWFFASIFIFILCANWFGLLPGVGTIGYGHQTPAGFVVDQPILRGANADLNMTSAMAIVFFALWIIWGLQANGVKGFILHIFGTKGKSAGFMKFIMVAVFIAVGLLEVVSILFRPVSLSFRLYGNVYAGETMLEKMSTIASLPWSALIPVPFFFLELIVGLVQALVFMLLTSVFTLLITQHDESHGHGHGDDSDHGHDHDHSGHTHAHAVKH